MRHLYSNECHDESEVWCGETRYFGDGEPTRDCRQATCEKCLAAAAEYGAGAAQRLANIRYARLHGVEVP